MAASSEPSERLSTSERPSNSRRVAIGFGIWAAWTAAWLILAFIYGRPLAYTADRAREVRLEAAPAALSASRGELIISQVDGWQLRVWRVKSGALTGPQVTDLQALTRQAVRDAGTQRGPDPQRKGRSDAKEAAEYLQSPIQQSRPQSPRESAQGIPSDLADTPAPLSVSVSPGGSDVAWIVRDVLFTTSITQNPVARLLSSALNDGAGITTTPLRGRQCVTELGSLSLLVACSARLEIRDLRGGRLRGTINGRLTPLRTTDGAMFAASTTDLFDIPAAGESYVRVNVPLKSAPRAIARTGDTLAVATDEGTILVVPGSRPATTITAPGVVDTLAFLNPEALVVGGSFRGIHVVGLSGESEPLIPDIIGTRFLSSPDATHLAYAAANQLAIVPWSAARAFSTRGYVFLVLAVSPILLVVMLLAVGTVIGGPLSGSDTAKTESEPARQSPPLSLPLPDPPQGLIKACVEGECVLYAGAGLSAQAGYPTWQPFVESLLAWGTETSGTSTNSLKGTNDAIQKTDAAFSESLRAALAAGQVDPVADSLVSAIGKPNVIVRLRETFGRERRVPNAYRLLKRIPFCAALTTNFDTLLERTYPEAVDRVLTPRDAERLQELLGRRQFFIGKLYGSLTDPESVVVAPADYAEVISRNLPFSQSLEGLFVSRTLLFIGASMEGIEAYLSGLTFRGQMTRPHYALVATTDAGWRAKSDLLRRRYSIEVLPFTPGQTFGELPKFLERLAEAVSAAEQPAVEARRSTTTEGLRRLVLQNIGPFPELELDLQSDWNVILGDNGVGKSSILKAIATCFCGRDAAPYAARLIRSGATSGSIVLETARNTYRMELKRTDAAAEVSVVPSRPLEAEGGLALGFPPLRAVSWERPKGPTAEGRRRVSVEDLLPIVKGDPDPRLDRLKQWIVNLDSRINYERSQGGDGRYERLLERFFAIVGQVTPGMSIRFGHVNQDTREVTVITEDGEIPIEMVSQGSISLMGWIGVLLQRLYEIFGDDADPTERYALVLIDEIDAHMHPEWQQSIVQQMTSIFPRVQYVATTHSPLVVGGMKGRQVLRFVRDAEGATIRVPVTDEMLLGRADQILTGRLFGMKTTLDQRTQGTIEVYKKLLGKRQRTPEEEIEFARLDRVLRLKIPLAEETPPERKAFALVEAIINDQIEQAAPGTREKALGTLRELMDELQAHSA